LFEVHVAAYPVMLPPLLGGAVNVTDPVVPVTENVPIVGAPGAAIWTAPALQPPGELGTPR
jgi:hypothetical protein